MGSGMDGRRDLRRLLVLESRLGIRVSEAVDEAVSSQTRLSTKCPVVGGLHPRGLSEA